MRAILLTSNHYLMSEWSSKNIIDPKDARSINCVWWKCSKCLHEWQASLANRRKKNPTGCPLCAAKKIGIANQINSITSNRYTKRNCIRCLAEFYPNNPNQKHCSRKCMDKGKRLNSKGFSKNYRFRNALEIRGYNNKWRKTVYERDHYLCRICGRHPQGKSLQAHHMLSIEKYPRKILDVSNGVSLCSLCHKTYQSYDISKIIGPNNTNNISFWDSTVEELFLDIYVKDKKIENIKPLLPLPKDSPFVINHPSIDEWMWEKNFRLGLSPDWISLGSCRKAWWKCKNCNNEWFTQINNRTKLGCGCPKCSWKRRIRDEQGHFTGK